MSRLWRLFALSAVWSSVLAAEALTRAASYALRAPELTPTSNVIEQQLGYHQWALVLTALAALMLLGLHHRAWPVAIISHAVGVFAYVTLGTSVVYAAVRYDQPWSSATPLLVIALMHAARLSYVLEHVRVQCQPHDDRGW